MKLNSLLRSSQAVQTRKKGEDTTPSVPKDRPLDGDTIHLSSLTGPGLGARLRSGLRKALLASAMFVSMAGPLAAQMPVGTAPLLLDTAARVELVQQPVKAVNDTLPKSKISVRASFINDNMPEFMSGALGNSKTNIPGTRFADDDGWTSELRLETTVTRPGRETFVGARLNMITETGSRNTGPSDYQGRRTDLGELVVQENFRRELPGGQTLDYGFGGGVQAFGNLGGESVQRWWHSKGPFGGRTGDALQGNQMSESIRAVPIATAGISLTTAATQGLSLKAGAQATVPFGAGLAQAGAKAGVQGDFGPLDVELGGTLDAAWNLAPELSFHSPSGVHPGAYLRTELQAGKVGGIFTQAQIGGLRREPILTVGVKIGLGQKARLNPFW